jgi:Rrf2 family cysteine metabolism transcriptional repressor
LTVIRLSDKVHEDDSIGNNEGKVKISTRGRYGTRALVELALNYDKGLTLLKDIARKQRISQRYLEHVIRPLVAGGVLRSTRGAGGGITLARPPEEIKMSEIVRLLEGSIAPVDCVNDKAICERSDTCAARDIWCDLQNAINGVLESTSLQDLVERQKGKGPAPANVDGNSRC